MLIYILVKGAFFKEPYEPTSISLLRPALIIRLLSYKRIKERMIKRGLLIVSFLIFSFLSLNSAFAYVLDGRLEDWGITRYTYTVNSHTNYWIDNWYPSDPNIDRKVHNNTREGGGPVWGGEAYDVETLYFDDDPYYLYFAMTTSFPLIGRNGVIAGDLAIDFTGAPSDDYKYGLKIKGIPGSEYDLSDRELRVNPGWYFNGHGQGPIYMTNFGDFSGLGEIYYWNAQEGGYLNEPSTSYHTWIIEGRINRFLFGPVPQQGDTVKLHWAMTCGNDYIDLYGDFDTSPIPEPTTLSLLGLGLVGILGLKKRKVQQSRTANRVRSTAQ